MDRFPKRVEEEEGIRQELKTEGPLALQSTGWPTGGRDGGGGKAGGLAADVGGGQELKKDGRRRSWQQSIL